MGKRRVTYSAERFAKVLEQQMASTLGLSASDGIESIEFMNNTFIINIDNKHAIRGRKTRQMRSDVVTPNRPGHGRG